MVTRIDVNFVCGFQHVAKIGRIAWSKDGLNLACPARDGRVLLYNLDTRQLYELKGHTGPVISAAFAQDGTLATGGFDKNILIWRENSDMPRVLEGHSAQINSLAWSPDGTLASGSEDGSIRFWNLTNGTVTCVHTAKTTCVAFCPDGTRLASSHLDGGIRVWDAQNRTLQAILPIHFAEVLMVAFETDDVLASASKDGTVKRLNIEKRFSQAVLHRTAAHVTAIAYSQDKRFLLTKDRGNAVCVYMRRSDGFSKVASLFERPSFPDWNVGLECHPRRPLLFATNGEGDLGVHVWELDMDPL